MYLDKDLDIYRNKCVWINILIDINDRAAELAAPVADSADPILIPHDEQKKNK